MGIVSVCLIVLAAYDDGRLLVWDEPFQRSVESHRLTPLDDVVTAATQLGSLSLLLPLSVGAMILIWPRSRAASAAIVVALVGSAVLTYGLKAVVDRERPDMTPLVSADFQSFPSGHVIQAVALWGMLPLIVAALSDRRELWWASVWFTTAVVAIVATSRVYLGVHWLSDVLAGLLAGFSVLLAADATYQYVDSRDPSCQ